MTASVSVVIPAYNAQSFLADAIESARSQSIAPAEVIVVDDGSTDATADVAARFGPAVALIRQPNAGIGAARNAGLAAATGDWLAFLDADDLWTPDKTALQLAAFDTEPALDIVFGSMQPFLHADAPPAVREAAVLDASPALVPGTMLIRRSAFDRAGAFVTNLQLGEFIEWFERARALGLRYASVEAVVLHRRIHANNTGLRGRDRRPDYLTVVRQALQRRRLAASE